MSLRAFCEKHFDKVRNSGDHNIMAVCPFHVGPNGQPERNPSFTVSLRKGAFFCFSCQEKGSFRQLLTKMGMYGAGPSSYQELLDSIENDDSWVDDVLPDPRKPAGYNANQVLPESLLGLFDKCPVSLLENGFHEKTLQHFGVGVDEKHYRITYPLRDMAGRLVGISGRATQDWQRSRYKVYTKEYEDFGLREHRTDKQYVLWNVDQVLLQRSLQPSSVRDPLILVEGFKACMWVHQQGYSKVVALAGSYVSEFHLWLLDTIGGPIYIMLDNNEAGKKGTEIALGRLSKNNPTVYTIPYPDHREQPDTLSSSELATAFYNRIDFVTWKLRHGIRQPKHP